MASNRLVDDVPGTVLLEDLSGLRAKVTLHPTPSRDPNDPLNWPLWRKNLNFALALYYTLMVFALIDVSPVTWAPMNEELGFSYNILTDSWAASCGGLAVGSPILIPLAMKFGRRPIYIFSTLAQVLFAVWLAKQRTVEDLMLTQILTNLVGALAEVLVQMTIADVFFVHQRGRYNTVYYFFMSFGSSIPSTIAGYIATNQGWRWVWWWLVILLGLGLALFTFLYEETSYSRVLDSVPGPSSPVQVDDEATYAKPQGSSDSDLDVKRPITSSSVETVQPDWSMPRRTYWQKLSIFNVTPLSAKDMLRCAYEPFLLLYHFPAVLFVALLYGAVTCTVVVTATTVGDQLPLPPYNFDPAAVGLMSIPGFIGVVLASCVYYPLSDRSVLWAAKRHSGVYEPEMRLWLPACFIVFVPIGLFTFGVTVDRGDHWIFPALGLAITSFGSTIPSAAVLTYLTDSYSELVGVAFVGVTVLRNLISMSFIFIQPAWVDKSGLTWFYVGFGLIVTAVLMGIPMFIVFGKRFRAHSAAKYRVYAKKVKALQVE